MASISTSISSIANVVELDSDKATRRASNNAATGAGLVAFHLWVKSIKEDQDKEDS